MEKDRVIKKSFTIFFIVIFILSFFDGIKTSAIVTITGNNSPATAVEVVSFPFTAVVDIAQEDNYAWFKIIVDRDITLQVKKTKSDSSIAYAFVTFFKENEETDELESVGQIEYNPKYKLQKGIYYIRCSKNNSNSAYPIEISEIEDNYNENNDTWDKATNVNFGEKIDFKISAKNDYDWYKVNINDRGTLKISTNQTNQLHYEIYKKNDGLDKMYEGPYIDGAVGALVDPGIYYIKTYQSVYGAWPNEVYQTIPYEDDLLFEFFKDDKYENNDEPVKAKALEINKDIEINLQSTDDKDWFYVNAGDKGATLRVTLKPKDIENNMYVSCSNYTDKILEDSKTKANLSYNYIYSPNNNAAEKKVSFKLQPGVNYVEFFTTDIGSINRIVNNDIIINAELINDEYENNDTIDKASDIILDKPMNIILDQNVDEDWFKINLSEPAILKVDLNAEEASVLAYYKTEDMEKEAYFFQGYKGNNSSYIYLNKGITYFKFVTNVYKNTAILNYSVIPTNMEYNGTIDTAYPIELGKQIEFTSAKYNISNINQYFKVDIDEDNKKVIPNYYGIDCSYGVLNDGTVSWKSFYSGSTYTLNKGTYYFKIKGNNNLVDNKVIFLIDENSTEKVPKVTMPSGSTTNVSVMPTLKFKFSNNIDVKTLNNENIKLYEGNEEIPINYTYSSESKELVIQPVSDLKNSTNYRVVLSSDIKGLEYGYKMNHSYEYAFKTIEKAIPEAEKGELNLKVKMPEFQDKSISTLISAKITIVGENNYLDYRTINDINNLKLELPKGKYEIQVDVPMMLSDKKEVEVKDGEEVNVELEPLLGDLNGDGVVDVVDMTILGKNYYETSKVIGE